MDVLHSPATEQGKSDQLYSPDPPLHTSLASLISCSFSCLLECLAPAIAISEQVKLLQSFGFIQHDIFAHHNWKMC